MAEEVITVRLTGEASDLIRELKKALRELNKVKDAADDADDALDDVGHTSKKSAKEVDRVGKAAQAAGGRFGELYGRAEAAAAAAGPMGLAFGAAALALTASTAAAIEMGSAAVDLTRHLGDITERADELAALGAGLDDDDIQAIEDANKSLDTLSATFDRLVVAITSSQGFIGGMERAAGAVNGLFLLIEQNSAAIQQMRDLADTALLVATGFTNMERVTGLASAAVDALNESTSELQAQQEYQAWVTAQLAEQERDRAEIREMEIARINMENAVEAARGKIKEQSADKAIAATEKEAEARKAFYEAEDALFFKQQREQEEAEAAAAERRAEERAARLQARIDEAVFNEELLAQQTAAQKAAALERAQIMVDYAEQVDSIGQMLLQHEIDRQGDLEGKSLTTQRRVFRMQKAADLASATISTARAVTAALAYPPGPPGTIPMAALTGAAGAVQIGLIAAQQPSFHIGSRAGDLAPDEVRATLTRGEAVLTRQAQAALGLDTEGVASANAGISGEQTIVLQYQHDRISQRYHRDQQAMQTPGKIGRARKL